MCDGSPADVGIVSALLTKFEKTHPDTVFDVQVYRSGEKLLSAIKKGKAYDLFLLDVIMPGVTGIELARILRGEAPDVPVVFLTSSRDYALHAFRVSAMQYLLKPVAEDELFDALDKILSLQKLEKERYFILQAPGGTLKLSYSHIVYAEVADHIMIVRVDNGAAFSSKKLSVPFGTAAAPLLADNRFLRVHKSFILNMEHVQELKDRSFIMTGGFVLPIPKYKIAEAKDAYFAYLSRCGYGRFKGGA